MASHVFAQSPASADQARSAYEAAQGRFEKASTDPKAAWELGRAAFDLAELSEDSGERSAAAEAGVQACRQAITLDPDSAPAHYYLALNLGELARSRKLSAFKLLHEMEHELLKAEQLEPGLDYAGPERAVGMLYLEAPSFLIGVGSRNKARLHLEAAIQNAPDFPENHLALAEAYAKWSEVKNLERELRTIKELLPKARTHFIGEGWKASWRDWETRLQKLEKTQDQLLAQPKISPAERGARRR